MSWAVCWALACVSWLPQYNATASAGGVVSDRHAENGTKAMQMSVGSFDPCYSRLIFDQFL